MSIDLICGCMFSGKTSELIRLLRRDEVIEKKCIVIKYSDDLRYNEFKVATHDGIIGNFKTLRSKSLKQVDEIVKDYDTIGIDELQFFTDAPLMCDKWANQGKHVIACGLSGKFTRKPFNVISEMVALADRITHLSAICKHTGREAPFTYRKIIGDADEVLIGGEDVYEAVDRETYIKKISNKEFMTNFEKVREFHKTFNHPDNYTYQENIFDENSKLVKLRYDLIYEEFTELCDAIKEHNMVEIIDALGDILYVVYGAGSVFGVDLHLSTFKNQHNFSFVIQELNDHKFNIIGNINHKDLLVSHNNLIDEYVKQLNEDINNLEIAINNKSITQVENSLLSILKTTYVGGLLFKINLDDAFDLIHKSNMTKACKTEDEAYKTVEWYKTHKLDTYDTPIYKKSNCGNYWIILNESTGKILKNINYSAVDLSSLVV